MIIRALSLKRLSLALLVGFILAGASAPSYAATKRPFVLDDALKLDTLAFDPQGGVAPNADWITYSVTTGYRERTGTLLDNAAGANGTHVLVRNLAANEAIPVTTGAEFSWRPSWSPDGDRLAMYVWNRDHVEVGVWSHQERKLQLYPMPPTSGRIALQWHPSGQFLLVPTNRLPLGTSTRPYSDNKLVNVISSDEDPQPYDRLQIEARSSGLAVLDLASGAVRTLLQPEHPNLSFRISPDGSQVEFEESIRDVIWVSFMPPTNRIAVVPWTAGAPKIVVPETRSHSVSWSPNGQMLAYTDAGTLLLVLGSGRVSRRLGSTAAQYSGTPVWSTDGRYIFCNMGREVGQVSIETGASEALSSNIPGTKSEIVLSSDGQTAWFKFVNSDSMDEGLASTTLWDRNAKVLFIKPAHFSKLSVTKSGLLYTLEDEATPPNLWRFGTSGASQITNVNSQIADIALGRARLVHWTTSDGEPDQGVLLLPPAWREGKKLPILVWVYETFSSRLHEFESHPYNLQLLAAREFGVLMPDVDLKTGHTARCYESAVVPALAALQQQGYADGRFALMGHSFGGFATNMLVTRTDRFRAAVAIAGISDWITFNGSPGDFMQRANEHGQGHLGAPLWEAPESYVENSPVFHLDKVATPLLIIHGMNDVGVPFQQAETMYYGLRRLRKPAVLVAYPHEDHLYAGTREAVFRDMWARIFSWLNRYMQ